MALKAKQFETSLLIEHRLGLPPLFYHRLREISDDWGFVLKLHAFFEGVLTHTIVHKLRRHPKSGEGLTPLDSFTSRVQLADRLGVLEPDPKAFLLALNKLRNELTHNIGFIDFDLDRYARSLSDRYFAKTARTLCTGALDEPLNSEDARVTAAQAKQRRTTTLRQMLFQQSPRESIWFSGLMALEVLSLHCIFDLDSDPVAVEPDVEGTLQDLLLDPAVMDYKRRFKPLWAYGEG